MSEPIDGVRTNVFFSDSQPTGAPSGTVAIDASVPEGFVAVSPNFAEQLTTQHSCWFEATLEATEEFTRDVPNVGEEGLAMLDERGVGKVGAAVKPGSLLIGKVAARGTTPLTPEEKLLRAIFGEMAGDVVDRSLRAPPLCSGTVSAVELSPPLARVQVSWSRPLEPGDELDFDGQRRVVSAIRKVEGDFATAGVAANARVTKVSCARDALMVRGIGPYDPQTQLPLGGATLGADARDVLASHAPWMLWETMTLKADAVMSRSRAYESLVQHQNPAKDEGASR